jgi:DNA-binding IclR family transcriptional regulator
MNTGGAHDGGDVALIPRVFAVLAAFRDAPVLGISELARRTGIPRTTVHRIATQLTAQGALLRVGTRYRPGPTLFELGSVHYPARLSDAVDPYLVDLQRLTGGEIALCELTGADVIVVHSVRGRGRRGPALPRIAAGVRVPAHACAAGKILLAHRRGLPYPRSSALPAVTDRTVTDLGRLRSELVAVRREGIAIEQGELVEGCTTIAAPVPNRHGRVLGALMSLTLIDATDVPSVAAAVATMARTLTRAGQTADIDYLARAFPSS